jgi:hypothetical protein
MVELVSHQALLVQELVEPEVVVVVLTLAVA